MRTPLQWEQVFLQMSHDIAQRSKDDSTQVGAVLVGKGNIILSCGFNGPPPQLDDSRVPWNIRPDKYNFIIHAEENCLLFALESHGKWAIKDSTLYCTHKPCSHCVLRLIRSNIGKVVYPLDANDYPLNKFIDSYDKIVELQLFPKIEIVQMEYHH